MALPPVFIFGLDGTIADPTHRLSLLPKWSEFEKACHKDLPMPASIKIMAALHLSGGEIWIWTGRSEAARNDTIKWLSKHAPGLNLTAWSAPQFRMREPGDTQSGRALKMSWFDDLTHEDQKRIAAVFEDDRTAINMWRRKGIASFQPFLGLYV